MKFLLRDVSTYPRGLISYGLQLRMTVQISPCIVSSLSAPSNPQSPQSHKPPTVWLSGSTSETDSYAWYTDRRFTCSRLGRRLGSVLGQLPPHSHLTQNWLWKQEPSLIVNKSQKLPNLEIKTFCISDCMLQCMWQNSTTIFFRNEKKMSNLCQNMWLNRFHSCKLSLSKFCQFSKYTTLLPITLSCKLVSIEWWGTKKLHKCVNQP